MLCLPTEKISYYGKMENLGKKSRRKKNENKEPQNKSFNLKRRVGNASNT